MYRCRAVEGGSDNYTEHEDNGDIELGSEFRSEVVCYVHPLTRENQVLHLSFDQVVQFVLDSSSQRTGKGGGELVMAGLL